MKAQFRLSAYMSNLKFQISSGHIVFNGKTTNINRKRRSIDDVISFTFDNSVTPVISEIMDHKESYSTYDIIKFIGTGFSTGKPSNNIVKIGEHECTTFEASSSVIKCRVNSMEVIDMYTKHEISFSVAGVGDGRVNISSYGGRVILFKPHVASMIPDSGSTEGGSSVVLYGSGLDGPSLEIRIGQQQCAVIETSKQYGSVQCVVPPSLNAQAGNLSSLLSFIDPVNVDQWGMPVTIETGLSYTYSSLVTLNVSSIIPSITDKLGEILTINIGNYDGVNVTELSIKLKDVSSKDEFSCLIDKELSSGSQVV